MPDNLHPWRRLLAFYLDMLLFMLPIELAWILIDLEHYSYFLTQYYGLPMALLKAVTALPAMVFCLHRFKTTPGKWLMGIRLTAPPGVGFTKLFQRSLYAFVLGAGMLLSTVSWILLFFSYRTLRFTGMTSWDRTFGTQVSHSRLRGGKIAAFVVVLLACAALENIPLNLPFIRQLVAYSYSPTYCVVSVSSGSLSANPGQIELAAEAKSGAARVKESGGSYGVDRFLSDIDTLTVRVLPGFLPELPDGLELELKIQGAPRAMLSLFIDAKMTRVAGDGAVRVDFDVSSRDRLSQSSGISGAFSARIEPGGPARVTETLNFS